MTNFEKHKNEILKIIRNTNSSPGMKNGKLYNCGQLRCPECEFNNSNGKYNKLSWSVEKLLELEVVNG